ncbi:mechanosensitive ion channel [Candidatus Woesearchaeota archaeon]|nr:mechanosensitive ion channel [Candidatus Woesearchaeota archaeon]
MAFPIDQTTQAVITLVNNPTTLTLLYTVAILLGGYLFAQIISRIMGYSYGKRKINTKEYKLTDKEHSKAIKLAKNTIMIITVIVALMYLRAPIVENFFMNTYVLIPNILTTILLLILGITVANLLIQLLERFFETIGLTDFMRATKNATFNRFIFIAAKLFLYVLVIEIALSILGINLRIVSTFLSVALYIVFGLFFVLLFFALKEPAENMAAGFYLRGLKGFKEGQLLRVGETVGKVEQITNLATTISADSTYTVTIPNKKLLSEELYFKTAGIDLQTIEDLKNHFIPQKTPSSCGPAVGETVLKIFGINNIDHDKIYKGIGLKEGQGGTAPKDLILFLEKATKKQVLGAWIDTNHMGSLRDETKTWLSEGGLTVVDYKKSVFFAESRGGAHYGVCVGVDGDELVIIDPSRKSGGVFLANYRLMFKGMDTTSKLFNGKRGYIVFAPKGTIAHHRIEEGLIYSDISFYDKLSKTLERKLNDLIDKTELLETVLPPALKKYLEKRKGKDKISRLWRPKTL